MKDQRKKWKKEWIQFLNVENHQIQLFSTTLSQGHRIELRESKSIELRALPAHAVRSAQPSDRNKVSWKTIPAMLCEAWCRFHVSLCFYRLMFSGNAWVMGRSSNESCLSSRWSTEKYRASNTWTRLIDGTCYDPRNLRQRQQLQLQGRQRQRQQQALQ